LSDKEPVAIAIAGVAGRMGQALLRAALATKTVTVTGATERPGSLALGRDLGDMMGAPPLGVTVSPDVEEAAANARVWIDFTTPGAMTAALTSLQNTKVRGVIVGTTGLEPADDKAIDTAAKDLVIVQSGNFSLGVNVLAALVQQAAKALGPDWDIEILETHHRRKIDAPSGTALLLGEAAAEGRGEKLKNLRIPVTEGITGPRTEGGIGFAIRRGGGIVGEHEVAFLTEAESIRLSHHATDRALFAKGALTAACWTGSGVANGRYGMQNVLFGN
jgi:4-hydroxy-tetrahydrodipicolinate reductase